MTEQRQRSCIVQKGSNGFGFILCCENDTTDTYILHVAGSSPAGVAGLHPGDRIIEVNGVNVEREEHKKVVERLQGLQSVRLVVAYNDDAAEYFKKPTSGMTVKPLESEDTGPRPKLISVRKSEKGFDFALQTVGKTKKSGSDKQRTQLKGITGHYASSVRADGSAYRAGLREGCRVIEINGVNVEQESHAYVIATIKSADRLEMLMVDKETDEYFKRQGVSPSSKYLHGKLDIKPSSPKKELRPMVNSTYSSPSSIYEEQTIQKFRPSILLSTPKSSLHINDSSLLAASTPNLSGVGLGRATPTYNGSEYGDYRALSSAERKQRTSHSKKEIKKRLSRREKKSAKLLYDKMDMPGSRNLYDETTISDDDDTSSVCSSSTITSTSSYLDPRIQSLSLYDYYSAPTRLRRSSSDASKIKKRLSSFFKPKLSSTNEKVRMTFEGPKSEPPPPDYEYPGEATSVGFDVDLKTLKNRVRHESSRKKSEIVRSKSKLSDYSLAHMYVNSY